MARIFITGSSDGLGLLTANALIKKGHNVTIHARSQTRADHAKRECPGAKSCLIADLSSLSSTKALADELNASGPWDAIIHNAGTGFGGSGTRGAMSPDMDGVGATFAVNTLAPYVLISKVDPPATRTVVVSSSMHSGGDAELRNLAGSGYADTKLHDIMLVQAFIASSKRFAAGNGSGSVINSLDPGWVATKMGGMNASDDIGKAVDTYVMLALGEGKSKGETGKHWYQSQERRFVGAAKEEKRWRKLVEECEKFTGVKME